MKFKSWKEAAETIILGKEILIEEVLLDLENVTGQSTRTIAVITGNNFCEILPMGREEIALNILYDMLDAKIYLGLDTHPIDSIIASLGKSTK